MKIARKAAVQIHATLTMSNTTIGFSCKRSIRIVIPSMRPVTQILDMTRTVVNVTGDATVSILVAKSEDDIDEDVFRSESVI